MHSLTTEVPVYPARIQRAVTTVFQHPFFKRLTPLARQILGEIVIRAKQFDACAVIHFKRENVAKKLGCNRKSVYNALASFERDGWIERMDQDVSAEGFFQCAPIVITPQLAQLLDLPYSGSNQEAAAYPQPSHGPDLASLNRGQKTEHINRGVNNLFEKQPTGAVSQTEPRKPRSPRKHLFADASLALLRTAGISRNGVFALMGLCKKHGGQRLSTIVECVRASIDRLQSGRLFGYLRACILSGTDFGVKQSEQAANDATATAKLRRRQFIADFAGRRLFAKDGAYVDVFDGACECYRADGTRVGSDMLQNVFDAFEKGLLAPR